MPFFGGISSYHIVGTNIKGGNDAAAAVTGNNNIALGNGALANIIGGDYNVGIGNDSGSGVINGSDNVFIEADYLGGPHADVSYSVCVGNFNTTGGDYSYVIGHQSDVTNGYGVALGYQVSCSANGVSIGNQSYAGVESVACGESAGCGYSSVAIGHGASSGDNAIAIGHGVMCGANAIQIGDASFTGPVKVGPYDLSTMGGAGALFSAVLTANQSISQAIITKALFDTVLFDTGSGWDAVNHQYVPKKAGYYQINTSLAFFGSPLTSAAIYIYLNGSAYRQQVGGSAAASAARSIVNSAIVYCNGTSDAISVYGLILGTTPSFQSTNKESYLEIKFLRS